MRDRERVVITGLGIVAATGIGIEPFWKHLLSGTSAIGPLTRFTHRDLPPIPVGEVRENLHGTLPQEFFGSRYSRTSRLAVIAALEAVRSAGLDSATLRRHAPVPILIGVSTSDTDTIERQVLRIANRGPQQASPFTAIASLPHAATSAVATAVGVSAHALTVSTGCPGAMDAIALAARIIRDGEAELAIAGGADAPITMLTVATFVASKMVAINWSRPDHAGRPFDAFREGGVLAEGASVVVLERLSHAKRRGIQPLAEFCSAASIADTPDCPPASGLVDCIEATLKEGGLTSEDIDWINAHGPGDPELDRREADAIHKCFGARASQIPVTSIKGTIGNPLAAAGACQLVAAVLGFRDDLIPPTANHETSDPACNLRIVAERPLRYRSRHVLLNNHGFGGSNSSLVVRRFQP